MLPGTDPEGALIAALSELEGNERRVLVIDQAEEIFSPEVPPARRAAFMDSLAELTAASNDRGCVVVMGLRADFYGQAAREVTLLPALRTAQLLLGAMSIDELRQAIVSPAEARGVAVDDELVNLLIRDLDPAPGRGAGYDPGALPLVSHALLASWRNHTGGRLTVADYLSAGGLHGAVKQTAEQMLASFDDTGRAAAQWLFTQLVLVDADGAMTRRRVEHDSLRHPDPATDRALDEVIEACIAGRLITAGETTLEISHEAMLTAWPRLHDWVLADVDAARLQTRIAQAAQVWQENDRDPDLLLRGGPLQDAEELSQATSTSSRTLTASESEYVQASAERASQGRMAERRRVRILRSIVAVTTVLALLTTALAGAAWWARAEADDQRVAAEQARDEAQAGELAITAATIRERDPAAAAQLSLAAYRVSPTLAARSSLSDSTGVPTPARFPVTPGEMSAAATGDGSLLAVTGKDGVTRLWQRTDSGTYEQLSDVQSNAPGTPGPIWVSAFTPDGALFVAADVADAYDASSVAFWDMRDPANPVSLPSVDIDGSAKSLAVSSDGTRLAIGTATGMVYRWDLGDGPPTQLPPHEAGEAEVSALAYSPDNQLLAGTSSGEILTVPGGREQALVVVDGVPTTVTDLAYSPDGRTVISTQKSGDVRQWRFAQSGRLTVVGEPFGDFDSWVNSAEFSADGQLLAAASSDGHVKIFTMPERRMAADLPTSSAASGVQFIGNEGVLTSEVGGVAQLWTLPLPVLRGLDDAVWNLAVDDSGRTLMVAMGLADGTVHMFQTDPATGPVLKQVLQSEEGPIDGAAAMSRDGRWVAAGTTDAKVFVWERRGDGMYGEALVLDSGETLVENVDISDDGQWLASVDDGGRLSVWRLRPGQRPELFDTGEFDGLGLSVAFDPQSRLLAVGTSENRVGLWHLEEDGLREGPELTGFTNYVYSVAFHPSGTYLAAGSTDQTVRLWDVSDRGAPIPVGDPLEGPGGTIYVLDWTADGSKLAAASKDGKVWLWNTDDPTKAQPSLTLDGPGGELYGLTFGAGDEVLAGGIDQMVTTWLTDVDAAAAELCQAAGVELTPDEWRRLVPGMDYVAAC
jgi:WD40 repeat protein